MRFLYNLQGTDLIYLNGKWLEERKERYLKAETSELNKENK
jgi:hypothetical protein